MGQRSDDDKAGALATKAQYFRVADGIEVVRFSGEYEPRQVLNLDYQICLTLSASPARVLYRRRERIFGAGQVSLLEPGEVHSFPRPVGRISFVGVALSPARFAAAILGDSRRATHFVDWPVPASSLRTLSAVERLFGRSSGCLERDEALERFVDELRLHCTERIATTPGVPATLRRVREYIADRYQEDLSLDDLADVSSTTREHVCRSFARAFGMTPHQYLVRIRIQAARERLAAGESAAEVAQSCGFVDQSHLTRWFKRLVFTTPSSYARALRA